MLPLAPVWFGPPPSHDDLADCKGDVLNSLKRGEDVPGLSLAVDANHCARSLHMDRVHG